MRGGAAAAQARSCPFSGFFSWVLRIRPVTPMAVASDSVRAGSLGVQVPENHTF
jgi:hypothetical protein